MTLRPPKTEEGVLLSWPGKQDLPDVQDLPPARLNLRELWNPMGLGEQLSGPPGGTLIQGDNLGIMSALSREHGGALDLIYIDPPFCTGDRFYRGRVAGDPDPAGRHQAYSDRWSGGMAGYLSMMAPRLTLMRELLNQRGSLLVHVDQRARSHLRLLLDEIFGPDALVNEIAWCYGGGGAPRRRYPRKYDTILWYARSKEWIFNRQYRPYSEGTLKRGLTAVKGDRYKLRPEGAGLDDWWTGPEVQKILSPTAYENLKYPTQKPEGLLRRIIGGHTDPGSLVGDFFCGSGTTLSVAGALGRRWIGCDAGTLAIQTCRKRLAGAGQDFELLVEQGLAGQGEAARRGYGVCLAGGRLTLTPPPGQGGPDFWAVDWAHDGEVFRGAWSCCARRRQPAALEVSAPAGVDPDRVRVMVVDAEGAEGILRVG